jgi:hypothetical protein
MSDATSKFEEIIKSQGGTISWLDAEKTVPSVKIDHRYATITSTPIPKGKVIVFESRKIRAGLRILGNQRYIDIVDHEKIRFAEKVKLLGGSVEHSRHSAMTRDAVVTMPEGHEVYKTIDGASDTFKFLIKHNRGRLILEGNGVSTTFTNMGL